MTKEGGIVEINDSTKVLYNRLLMQIEIIGRKPLSAHSILPCWPNLQSKLISPKARDLSWRLAHNILPNASKLFSFSCRPTPTCAFCTQVETVEHLFISCNIANQLLARLKQLCMFLFNPTGNFDIGPTEVLLNTVPIDKKLHKTKKFFWFYLQN